jgi:hypothetical protein
MIAALLRICDLIKTPMTSLTISILSLSLLTHLCRRIKVSFPSDVRRTQVEDIAVLTPGQQVALPLEIVLAGLGG